MKHLKRAVSYSSALAFVAGLSSVAQAQLGNVAYTEAELLQPISFFDENNFVANGANSPWGSNTAVMHKGLLIVMASHDSGKTPGTLHFFDVSDPKSPVLKHSVAGEPTAGLRELHAMPIAAVGGKDYLAMPTATGIQLWDVTDPMQAAPAAALPLPQVAGGDYDNAAWQLTWSPPYIFAGGLNLGIFVIDASNPAMPQLVTTIATGETGGFKVGPVHAAGNYLVVAGTDDSPAVSVIDVSDAANPFMVATGNSTGDPYSSLVIGDRVYMPGESGNVSIMSWNADTVQEIGKGKFGSTKGGYCTYQDAVIFCGQSEGGLAKIDVSDEKNMVSMGRATGGRPDHDEDFATVLGNLVFLGNDHGTGSSLIPHSMSPDMAPPTVVKVYPENGELMAPLTSRVTVFFSDNIDLSTVSRETLIVQPGTEGAPPLEGSYAISSFNAVSFGPSAPLVAGESYEVIVRAGGVKDISGNAVAEQVVAQFSTSNELKPPRTDVPGDPPVMPTGGAGGETMMPTEPTATAGAAAMGGAPTTPGAEPTGTTPPTSPTAGGAGSEVPTSGGMGGAAATPGPQLAPKSEGCAVASPRSGAGWGLLSALGLLALGRRRRQS